MLQLLWMACVAEMQALCLHQYRGDELHPYMETELARVDIPQLGTTPIRKCPVWMGQGTTDIVPIDLLSLRAGHPIVDNASLACILLPHRIYR